MVLSAPDMHISVNGFSSAVFEIQIQVSGDTYNRLSVVITRKVRGTKKCLIENEAHPNELCSQRIIGEGEEGRERKGERACVERC